MLPSNQCQPNCADGPTAVSVVSSRTKADAIEKLDERDNAHRAKVTRMSYCMFHFRLDDLGEFQLKNVGDATENVLLDECYPVLDKAREAARGMSRRKARKLIRQAVATERKRLWDSQPNPRPAKTELGRDLQKLLDAPAVMIDRAGRQAAETLSPSTDSGCK